VVLAEEVLPDIAAELEPALDKTFADLPDGFPQPLAEAIAAGIRRRAIAFHAV
jgi:serine/threonine-protein kinase HipA